MKTNITHLKQVCAISSRVWSILNPHHLEIVNQSEAKSKWYIGKVNAKCYFCDENWKTEKFYGSSEKLMKYKNNSFGAKEKKSGMCKPKSVGKLFSERDKNKKFSS